MKIAIVSFAAFIAFCFAYRFRPKQEVGTLKSWEEWEADQW